MKQECKTCFYFISQQNLREKLEELEFWEKRTLKELEELKKNAKTDKAKAKETAEINLTLARILAAFKLIYGPELREIAEKQKEPKNNV